MAHKTIRNTLICTVGTSLFAGNLKRLSADTPNKPDNWQEIKKYFDEQNWQFLAKELIKVEPSARVCGAEINTVQEVVVKNWMQLCNLFFLVSDTPDGENTGKFLKEYFTLRSKRDLKLNQIDFEVVENLQDKEPKKFKGLGLRNLVRCAGKIINRVGVENIAIDATGGYKAQIAVAVILGQALGVPVFYKHELFSEIIDFPPLPISFDYDMLGTNAALFVDFERGKAYTSAEIGEIDDKLRVLLNIIESDGEELFELNAIGQIYIDSFRARNPKPTNLVNAPEIAVPTFRDDNFPDGFKEFVAKVCCENKWITKAHSLPYNKQKSIKGIDFFVDNKSGDNRLIGTYKDASNFGARFALYLTDESARALNWAAVELTNKYRT